MPVLYPGNYCPPTLLRPPPLYNPPPSFSLLLPPLPFSSLPSSFPLAFIPPSSLLSSFSLPLPPPPFFPFFFFLSFPLSCLLSSPPAHSFTFPSFFFSLSSSSTQVVEIASLTKHQLVECEQAKGKFRECPRCKEAIKTSVFDRHVKTATCTITRGSNSNRCPLCHVTVPAGEEVCTCMYMCIYVYWFTCWSHSQF